MSPGICISANLDGKYAWLQAKRRAAHMSKNRVKVPEGHQDKQGTVTAQPGTPMSLGIVRHKTKPLYAPVQQIMWTCHCMLEMVPKSQDWTQQSTLHEQIVPGMKPARSTLVRWSEIYKVEKLMQRVKVSRTPSLAQIANLLLLQVNQQIMCQMLVRNAYLHMLSNTHAVHL